MMCLMEVTNNLKLVQSTSLSKWECIVWLDHSMHSDWRNKNLDYPIRFILYVACGYFFFPQKHCLTLEQELQ